MFGVTHVLRKSDGRNDTDDRQQQRQPGQDYHGVAVRWWWRAIAIGPLTARDDQHEQGEYAADDRDEIDQPQPA